jgi:hypothetical protein
MTSKDYKTAEYEALHRIVTADKRLRLFQYALTICLMILIMAGGISIQHNIAKKIDGLVGGSIERANQRAAEQKTIAKETTRYITCIFIIPIEQRTADNQQRCFNESDLPGGLTREDFSPYVAITNTFVTGLVATEEASPQSGASATSPASSSTPSSSQSTPSEPTPQSNLPQPNTNPNCTIDFLFIHIGSCQ